MYLDFRPFARNIIDRRIGFILRTNQSVYQMQTTKLIICMRIVFYFQLLVGSRCSIYTNFGGMSGYIEEAYHLIV